MGGHSKLHEKMMAAGFMPANEAARRAGVHATTIYRMVDAGKVQGCRVGRFRFVHRAELSQFYPEPIRSLILAEAA